MGKVLVLPLVFLLSGPGLSGQTIDPFIQEKVAQMDYDSIYHRMQAFEDFGIKTAGSGALDNTRDWITGLYQQWGYDDIELDEFSYGQHAVQNIIVTKTGTLHPDTYLIVDGHYDTWGGPGVNDNGSGTAIILETARLMKDVETAYSIRFIHFTVEEMGLVGSTHYVQNTVVPGNMDVRLVFNIDEVGGVAGEVNNTVTCERDESAPNGNNAASAAFTDTLATLTELYSDLDTYISYAYGSDYVPFMNAGYVVTGYYEYNESPYPHTLYDSLANLDPDYVFELAKASLASAMYFSGAQETVTAEALKNTDELVRIGPNPFLESLQVLNDQADEITLELSNASGTVCLRQRVPAFSKITVQLDLPKGIYFYRIFDGRTNINNGSLIHN